MSLVLEFLLTFALSIWYWIVGIFKAVVPQKFLKQKNVKGQVVLVTGAGSGLGRLISLRFACLGCKLVLWDIDENGNRETYNQVKAITSEVKAYKVDLSKREDIYETAVQVKSDIGDVDILVNNAGIVTGKKFLECPDVLIEKTMAVNSNAHFWTTKSFLPSMLSRNHGHIVSIASSAGLFGVSGLCDYSASKFAAVGFDESLRNELQKQKKTGVKTTVVCPFYINTGMFTGVKSRFPSLLPLLDADHVVDRIITAVLTNQEMLLIPRSIYLFYLLKGLVPVKVVEVLSNFFSVHDSMDDFVGRSKQN
ncbi:protein dhs-3-like isoform X1 [Biomphalaria glabrata]|uniref:Protein dhs-3-like isoform X1 n=1 Tax=Biomphalaria glabrata TaxID=6526 RepID=A0A9W2Z7F2_BIOGL|nr:protein dhs-3-like isoform X1 [Biomphalaria glabrata]XP_055870968.1 protein dhs-3-like isoform X1 [Biomphalaria glabrata]